MKMEFKRHHQHQGPSHQGYAFNSRPLNPGPHGAQFHPQNPFVAHHPHGPHPVRGFKQNDNSRISLNLSHSFRNLLKMQSDMAGERASSFQKLSQLRDLMLSRISSFANDLLKEEMFNALVTEIKESVTKKKAKSCVLERAEDGVAEVSCAGLHDSENEAEALEEVKARWFSQVQGVVSSIEEETRVYATREETFMGAVFSKERSVEKNFQEFFCDAERQIMECEKKLRNDQYGQMMTRLRGAEREMAMRDQKIAHLEETLKIVNDRTEKYMAELQQVNADHQFERLQLYHQAESCKFNAKCMAADELLKLCKWKHCVCGRDYEELYREFEGTFQASYPAIAGGVGGANAGQEVVGRHKDVPERREIMSCASNWLFPLSQSQVAQNMQLAIPTGSFVPSEETATKGLVMNDLRDRYDELQLKAAAIPNYEEVRTMIMKIVCHFKLAGFRVCEEMTGKQYVSSLFYCDESELLPSKEDKVFSTGYGETAEEATMRSVQRAMEEILRLERLSGDSGDLGTTHIRRGPTDNLLAKLETETIRMTLLRSYSSEKIDPMISNSHCIQDGNLYRNQITADDKYMADWKVHIRTEDSTEGGIKEKLKRILQQLSDKHVADFVHYRPLKEKH